VRQGVRQGVRQARQAVERERGGGEGHQKIVAPNSRNTGSFRNVSGDPSMRSLSGGATQAKGDQVRRGFQNHGQCHFLLLALFDTSLDPMVAPFNQRAPRKYGANIVFICERH
jgi:hypothetical protein